MSHQLPTTTIRYVSASQIFQGCPEAIHVFSEADVPFVWGTNKHSLISQDQFLEAIEEIAEEINTQEYETINQRIDSLPDDVLVDLES